MDKNRESDSATIVVDCVEFRRMQSLLQQHHIHHLQISAAIAIQHAV